MAEPTHIYLDHAAATPLLPEAGRAMMDAYAQAPANPSALGRPGRQAADRLAQGRAELAQALGVAPERVVITSGGTEAIGLAVLGTLGQRSDGHVVASAIEHPAVLGSVRLLERRGLAVTLVPPTSDGVVDPQRFAEAVRPDTRLACLMHVNNELGTVQPVAGALAGVRSRSPRCVTLVDAVQSFTRLPLDPDAWQADLLAVSGHKVGGPRGVGALVTGRRRPERLYGGGDQEWGARPGTEDVPAVAGFAAAVQHAAAHAEARLARVTETASALEAALAEQVPAARINGQRAERVPWICSVSVDGLPSEALVRGMEEHGVWVSAGAACHARSQKQSHVLEAIGVRRRTGTMRVSWGPDSSPDQARQVARALAQTVERYALP